MTPSRVRAVWTGSKRSGAHVEVLSESSDCLNCLSLDRSGLVHGVALSVISQGNWAMQSQGECASGTHEVDVRCAAEDNRVLVGVHRLDALALCESA